jgi:hypothetical protein
MDAAPVTVAIATTRIDVTRPARPSTEDPYGDGYDEPEDRDDSSATVATGVRATISPASVVGSNSGGESQVAEFRLACDPCDVTYRDTVTDTEGQTFEVLWAVSSPGVAGLGHVEAGLRIISGRSL